VTIIGKVFMKKIIPMLLLMIVSCNHDSLVQPEYTKPQEIRYDPNQENVKVDYNPDKINFRYYYKFKNNWEIKIQFGAFYLNLIQNKRHVLLAENLKGVVLNYNTMDVYSKINRFIHETGNQMTFTILIEFIPSMSDRRCNIYLSALGSEDGSINTTYWHDFITWEMRFYKVRWNNVKGKFQFTLNGNDLKKAVQFMGYNIRRETTKSNNNAPPDHKVEYFYADSFKEIEYAFLNIEITPK
jgi:hypothetical protein